MAWNLDALFDQHGPPLFMKMDGGSNFKHQVVRDLLAEFGVIPLISPHYPPYNGGVERERRELLRHLALRIGDQTVNARELRLECEVAGHEVIHKRRACLGDRTACYTLQNGRRRLGRFGRLERKEVFEDIRTLTSGRWQLTSPRSSTSIRMRSLRPHSAMLPKHGCSQTTT